MRTRKGSDLCETIDDLKQKARRAMSGAATKATRGTMRLMSSRGATIAGGRISGKDGEATSDLGPERLRFHPAADIFPLMKENSPEFKDLLADIVKTRGLIEPCRTLDGMLIIGRNRHNACRVAGIEPWISPSLRDGTAIRSHSSFPAIATGNSGHRCSLSASHSTSPMRVTAATVGASAVASINLGGKQKMKQPAHGANPK